MSLEEEIKEIAKKVVSEDEDIKAFLLINQEGMIVYSSLPEKSHSELFAALSKDIFKKIPPLGDALGVEKIEIAQMFLRDYEFHLFKEDIEEMGKMYILLLKA